MSMIGVKLNGRYEIREHLGEGSTATVYKAYDSLLSRDVALKILLPHVRDTTRKRFFQESTAAAQLNHPNIMSIYDRGEDNDRHFLVVEYVEGDPLTAYIPSSPEVVIELGSQIAIALHYAHEREIIHRDIKPANIKVTPDGQVKIMDLGLALPREAKRVTAPGMVIGTPAYISPEQAQGQELDRRTDIYSLGIVLYEMATGQLPFNADDITALLLQHVQQPAPPPRLVVPELPSALEHVILKTLEKKPSRRFQTAESLAGALRATMPNAGGARDATIPSREEWAKRTQTDRLDSKRAQQPPSISTVRIVLADDHALLRRTLASFLEARDDFVVLAEAGDGQSAVDKTIAVMPDILILDLNMPVKSGLEVLVEVREQAPRVKVLVLTGRQDEAYIVRSLRSGAHGYILKSTDESELVESIEKVLDGQIVLGKGVAEVVTSLLGVVPDERKLTDSERDVLLYVAGGYSDSEIAKRLDMPMTSVIESLAKSMNKLGAGDRHTAALTALRNGELVLEDLHMVAPPNQE